MLRVSVMLNTFSSFVCGIIIAMIAIKREWNNSRREHHCWFNFSSWRSSKTISLYVHSWNFPCVFERKFIYQLFFGRCRKDNQGEVEGITWQFPHPVENDSAWWERSAFGIAGRIYRNKVAVLSAAAVFGWKHGKIKKQLQQSIRRFQLRASSSVRAGNWNSERRWHRWWHKTRNLTKAPPKIIGIGIKGTARLIATFKRTKSVEITSETSAKIACHPTAQPHGRSFSFSTNDCRTNDNFSRSNASKSQSTAERELNIFERKTKKDWRSDHNGLWRQLKRRVPNSVKSKR